MIHIVAMVLGPIVLTGTVGSYGAGNEGGMSAGTLHRAQVAYGCTEIVAYEIVCFEQ